MKRTLEDEEAVEVKTTKKQKVEKPKPKKKKRKNASKSSQKSKKRKTSKQSKKKTPKQKADKAKAKSKAQPKEVVVEKPAEPLSPEAEKILKIVQTDKTTVQAPVQTDALPIPEPSFAAGDSFQPKLSPSPMKPPIMAMSSSTPMKPPITAPASTTPFATLTSTPLAALNSTTLGTRASGPNPTPTIFSTPLFQTHEEVSGEETEEVPGADQKYAWLTTNVRLLLNFVDFHRGIIAASTICLFLNVMMVTDVQLRFWNLSFDSFHLPQELRNFLTPAVLFTLTSALGYVVCLQRLSNWIKNVPGERSEYQQHQLHFRYFRLLYGITTCVTTLVIIFSNGASLSTSVLFNVMQCVAASFFGSLLAEFYWNMFNYDLNDSYTYHPILRSWGFCCLFYWVWKQNGYETLQISAFLIANHMALGQIIVFLTALGQNVTDARRIEKTEITFSILAIIISMVLTADGKMESLLQFFDTR